MAFGNKPYFPNLDALRFCAASSVICAHSWLHIPVTTESPVWINIFKKYAELGVLGVNFFFVLSGFLISYLLLYEIKQTDAFSIKRYFLRRILRIWPLFYLILFICFILFPVFKTYLFHQNIRETTPAFWYIFFINNFHDLFRGQPISPTLSSLWTIAVEEQFYILFPVILLLKKRNKILFPVLIIMISLIFRILINTQSKMLYYHTLSVIGDFGVGGLFAFAAFYKFKIFKTFIELPKKAIALFYFTFFSIFVFYYKLFDNTALLILERIILAILFGIIIIEQVFCKHSIFKLGSYRLLNFGGKISYGMYCFQYFAILPAYYLLLRLHIYEKPLAYLFFHPLLSITFSYLLAAFSHTYFELYFLKLKSKFYPA